MTPEPRFEGDCGDRQVEAARRVLVDVGQVLQSFREVIVLVGGWVPDLLLPDAEPAHVGSIDVDLALDAGKLSDGRFADLLKLLLDTRRYRAGEKDFQLVTNVDLGDGEAPIRVEVEFLAPANVRLKKNRPKRIEGFRVLQFSACAAAFVAPTEVAVSGPMVSGVPNTVRIRVASLADFIIMKCHALEGRDKPKDVYDICYCLDDYPGGIEALANNWRGRRGDALVEGAIRILGEKFATVDYYGPRQLATFHASTNKVDSDMHARRAFELVQKLLVLLQP